MKKIGYVLMATTVLLAAHASFGQVEISTRPNVVIILADDLGKVRNF